MLLKKRNYSFCNRSCTDVKGPLNCFKECCSLHPTKKSRRFVGSVNNEPLVVHVGGFLS